MAMARVRPIRRAPPVTSATPRVALLGAGGAVKGRLVQAAEFEEVQGAEADDENQDNADGEHGADSSWTPRL